jgi:hypothetical protein
MVRETTKAEQRAARDRVVAYHEAELAKLAAHVEEAFGKYRAGEIDVFGVDEVIHVYSKAARELWKFCWSGGGGSNLFRVLTALDLQSADGDDVEWWDVAESRRRR